MTPVELNHQGFQALIEALGYVNAVRFLKQFDQGSGNYTQDRDRWLSNLTLDQILPEPQSAARQDA
jgi:hypothetical protein